MNLLSSNLHHQRTQVFLKSWLNLVVPGSGTLSLLFVSPRGTANRSVAVRLSNLPPVMWFQIQLVTSPSILISPDREFKPPLVVSAMDTVFTIFDLVERNHHIW